MTANPTQKENPESALISEQLQLIKINFFELLDYLNDPENNEKMLYAVNSDPNSSQKNKPYKLAMNDKKNGFKLYSVETTKTNRPIDVIEFNTQIPRIKYFYLTQESADMLQKYLEKKSAANLQRENTQGRVQKFNF
ncbi:hypothetical protein JW911_01635 [Candidatus Peregrinibacteria bacterium]|nr:hypothetical protein [Candidatus Peregrinibacteria bacterium]